MKILLHFACCAALLTLSQPVLAETNALAAVNPDVGVPVFPSDIKDRHYTVIGQVQVGVRKATVFSKEASQEKIYQILWKHAKDMGADAVINARYGDSHLTALSWGSTTATGTAIKFTPENTKPSAP